MKYCIRLCLCFGFILPAWAGPENGTHALAAARDLTRGEIIAAGDIIRAALSKQDARRRHLAVSEQHVVGMEVKRNIRAGRHIALADVRRSSLIRKGDQVTLTYTSPGVRLSVRGRALANAYQGGPLAVMNLYSNRSVQAVAVATGQARIDAQ